MFIELMPSDRQLKASRQCSEWRNHGTSQFAALCCSKVDRFVPEIQHVNFRVVRPQLQELAQEASV